VAGIVQGVDALAIAKGQTAWAGGIAGTAETDAAAILTVLPDRALVATPSAIAVVARRVIAATVAASDFRCAAAAPTAATLRILVTAVSITALLVLVAADRDLLSKMTVKILDNAEISRVIPVALPLNEPAVLPVMLGVKIRRARTLLLRFAGFAVCAAAILARTLLTLGGTPLGAGFGQQPYREGAHPVEETPPGSVFRERAAQVVDPMAFGHVALQFLLMVGPHGRR
jgi:hypothetical protein